MAKVNIKMRDEDFLVELSRLGDRTDEIAEQVLQEGAKVVYDKVKSNLQSVIGKGVENSRSTGELVNALGISSVKIDGDGNYNIKVGFAEPRRKQYAAKGKRSYNEITNAMIANVIEYGKHNGQNPKPFIKPAIRATRKACTEAMKQKFESITKGD